MFKHYKVGCYVPEKYNIELKYFFCQTGFMVEDIFFLTLYLEKKNKVKINKVYLCKKFYLHTQVGIKNTYNNSLLCEMVKIVIIIYLFAREPWY